MVLATAYSASSWDVHGEGFNRRWLGIRQSLLNGRGLGSTPERDIYGARLSLYHCRLEKQR